MIRVMDRLFHLETIQHSCEKIEQKFALGRGVLSWPLPASYGGQLCTLWGVEPPDSIQLRDSWEH